MMQIEELEQLWQENQRLREANENWQACVHESLVTIGNLQEQVKDLKELD